MSFPTSVILWFYDSMFINRDACIIFLIISEAVTLCMKAILIQLLVEKDYLLPKYAFILNNRYGCIWILYQWMYFRYSLEHTSYICASVCTHVQKVQRTDALKTMQNSLEIQAKPKPKCFWCFLYHMFKASEISTQFWINKCFHVLFLNSNNLILEQNPEFY